MTLVLDPPVKIYPKIVFIYSYFVLLKNYILGWYTEEDRENVLHKSSGKWSIRNWSTKNKVDNLQHFNDFYLKLFNPSDMKKKDGSVKTKFFFELKLKNKIMAPNTFKIGWTDGQGLNVLRNLPSG